MAEQLTSKFNADERKDSYNSTVSEMISQVRNDIDQLVEGFDVNSITHRVEEFGKENPVGLALTALSIGLAAGLLMRNSSSQKTFSKS